MYTFIMNIEDLKKIRDIFSKCDEIKIAEFLDDNNYTVPFDSFYLNQFRFAYIDLEKLKLELGDDDISVAIRLFFDMGSVFLHYYHDHIFDDKNVGMPCIPKEWKIEQSDKYIEVSKNMHEYSVACSKAFRDFITMVYKPLNNN